MSCSSHTARKTANFVRTYVFKGDYDFSAYTAELRIAESEGAEVLLTVDGSGTGNGSITACAELSVSFDVTPADLQTLPDADPVSDPWEGVMEFAITAPDGTVTVIDHGSLSVEKGV